MVYIQEQYPADYNVTDQIGYYDVFTSITNWLNVYVFKYYHLYSLTILCFTHNKTNVY